MAVRSGRKLGLSIGLGTLGASLVMVATASAVFACAVLTTSTLSQSSGAPGTTVTLKGQHYGVAHGSVQQTFAPVEVRFDSLTGPVLATTIPAADGSISVPLTIPQDAVPGYHVLLTIQRNGQGQPVPGSPGRVMFQVGSAQSANGSAYAPAALQTVTSPQATASSSSSLGAAAIALIALGGVTLFLLGAGLGLREATARRRATPVKR